MKRPSTSLPAFTASFVPFALLLSAALLGAELGDSLDGARLVYSIWVSLALAIPGLALLLSERYRASDYARLYWSFAFCAYLVHFYYAFGVHYHFSLRELYAGQSTLIATSNLVMSAAWPIDIAALWLTVSPPRALAVTQWAIRGLFVIEAATSTLVVFDGPVRLIGIALIAALAITLGVRFLRNKRAAAAEPVLPPGALPR